MTEEDRFNIKEGLILSDDSEEDIQYLLVRFL